MRIGAWIPNVGTFPGDVGLVEMFGAAERAGFDLATLSDHVVMVEESSSRYPFTPDGKVSWDASAPWHDAVVALAAAAVATSEIEIGIGVLVLPVRHPVVAAKQLATIDSLSGGRVVLGVGAGWLAEEFAALNVDFASRGRRLDEWIHLLRALWSGRPAPFEGEHYRLPAGVLVYPTPVRPIPIVVGGMGAAALGRAARNDGWFALQLADRIDIGELERGIAQIRSRQGSDAATPRVLLRATGAAAGLAGDVRDLARVGVTDLIATIDWNDPDSPQAVHDMLREAMAGHASDRPGLS